MSAEQAFVLSKEDSPIFVGGGFHFTAPSLLNVPRIVEAFKNGGGIPYSEIGDEIPPAIERFAVGHPVLDSRFPCRFQQDVLETGAGPISRIARDA